MLTPRLPALLLFLAVPLAAQTTFTSPLGMENTEGSAVFYHWSGNRRFYQVDYSVAGPPRPILNFAVRRDGNRTQGAGGKTLDFTLDLGLADFGRLSQDLDSNYLQGSRKQVFPRTNVKFPDWGTAIPGPAPFDFKIAWNAPFLYTGQQALVIDFLCQNISGSGGGTTDREFVNPGGGLTGAKGNTLGQGCTATGQSSTFDHTSRFMNQGPLPNPKYGFRYRITGQYGPANAPVLIFVDYMDRNLAGLACTTLHALPVIHFTALTDASGRMADIYFGFDHDIYLEGASLYSQLVSLDQGQPGPPVALSNASVITIPMAPTSTSHRTFYAWYSLPGTGTHTLYFGGGMVIKLGL